jgi:hypothetical protein
MNRHTLYYNLHDAFAEEGCPICRLCSQAVDRYLEHLLYESVNDLEVRRNIRQSQGFCRKHAWQLLQRGDLLGIAIIHQDVILTIQRMLHREQRQRLHLSRAHWLRRVLPASVTQAAYRLATRLAPIRQCPACQKRVEVQDAYLETLLQHCADLQLLTAWRASDGLCWPHVQCAIGLIREEETLLLLMDLELAHFGHLGSELREFIRRHDYRLGSRGFGSASDSWVRAVTKVSGWEGQQ